MLIDITLKLTPELIANAQENLRKASAGHLGTHFDVMNKEFPLEYTKRKGVFFDVSDIKGRDIDICDIDLNKVEKDMFVAFYTGFIDEVEYGSETYFKKHPQLSYELIDALLDKQISIIGVDFSGLRNGKEHTPTDQHCADCGVFVVENMRNLEQVLKACDICTVNTYPMNYSKMTGLPCRVIAEI